MTAYTRYVNTSQAGAAGDGTTNGEGSGGTNAYFDLAFAFSEMDGVLGASDTLEILCSSGSGNVADDTASISTFASGAAVTIKGNRSSGTGFADAAAFYDTGVYRLEPGSSAANALTVAQSSTVVDGIQATVSTHASGYSGILTTAACTVRKCRVKTLSGGGTGIGHDAVSASSGFYTVTIENCIVAGDGVDAGASSGIGVNTATFYAHTMNVTNCHVYGAAARGIFIKHNGSNTSTLNAKNCCVIATPNDFVQLAGGGTETLNITYCASDDNDGTNSQDLLDTTTSWADEMVDPNNATQNSKDFSPNDTSSKLYNTGTTTGMPTDDIIDAARGSQPDIGAFFFAGGGGGGATVGRGLTRSLRLERLKRVA